ncbi:BZ3500_MvSof-1268-A1-R1_Chr4-3g07296 [Microbotryum saponariae]|uniref:BZ3500_MvSof-1268-A1-R1_Chr4-3g07296 protein n=1 Tax=Microbotryum saponariae TaxID=289078 RepID=A0A2X0LFH2_9BASI|nr:BZ3500_MvSof-1268-A1-R1_Chr4-3g07296 [Microbotryum saponariae]SDA06959.1 BZ3501_MvSof-1269-A2-R1_Chr4-2g07005 [Microbotryum saponariae]
MVTHHQIQIGTMSRRHQPAQAAVSATASTSKVPDDPDPIRARPPLFGHAYGAKPAQGTTTSAASATVAGAGGAQLTTSTIKTKVSLAPPGGSTFKTPVISKPKHGPLRSVHATLSDPRFRVRPNLVNESSRRLPKWGAESLDVDDEEDDRNEMDSSEDEDDDGFETTSDEEKDEDEEMYDVQMGRAQDDSGVGLLETPTNNVYEEEVKRKIRALERGSMIKAYQDNLELATAQYSHVVNDMKTLLKRDLGEEVGQELRTQIEGAMEHRSKLDDALIQERDHFVINAAEAIVTQAQDLINQLYEVQRKSIEGHKFYERNSLSSRNQAQAGIDVSSKNFDQESSKLIKKLSTPSIASNAGVPSVTSAKTKSKGKGRATR